MSHVVTIQTEFKDLDAIKAACKRLGWTFNQNQRTYKWYGRWVDDSPLPEHLFSPEELATLKAMNQDTRRTYMSQFLGRCVHCIQVPNCYYEIGIVTHNGQYYPVWDWYNVGGLESKMGQDGGPLAQAYAVELAKMEAIKQGMTCTEETMQDGSIKLKLVESY